MREAMKEQKPYSERTTPQQRKGYRLKRMKRAKRLHRALLRALCHPLRPHCRICKRKSPTVILDVDHERGRKYKAQRLRYDARVDRYWKEYRRGVKLRVLCRGCNGRDGMHRYWEGRISATDDK